MKQIIDRKVFNTENAEQIAKYGSVANKSDFQALAETLYKNSDGEYFLHCQGGAATEYAEVAAQGKTYGEELQVLTKEDALDWCEERSIDANKVIQEFDELLENVDNA